MMKNDGAGDGYVERRYFVCILLDIDEVVADCDLVFVQTWTLIAQDKKSGASERVLMDRLRLFHDLYSTYWYPFTGAKLSYFLESIKVSKVSFHVCPLRPERPHLLLRRGTGGATPIDNKHFIDVEGGSGADQIPKILLFLHVEHEHVRLRALLQVVLTHLFGFFIFWLLYLWLLLHWFLGFLFYLCVIFHFT